MKNCTYCDAINSEERDFCFKCDEPFEIPLEIPPLEDQLIEIQEDKVDKSIPVSSIFDFILIFSMMPSCGLIAEYSDYLAIPITIVGMVLLFFGLAMFIHRNDGVKNSKTKAYFTFLYGFLLSGIILIIISIDYNMLRNYYEQIS